MTRRRMRNVCGCLFVVVFSGLVPCIKADVIELFSGQRIEGPVLKEDANAVYVDIGVDIVKVPVERIRSRSKGMEEAEAKEDGSSDVASNGIYRTAKLPAKSVKDLAREFGPGVVLVQTPSGLGSGFILNAEGDCVTNYHVIEQETRIAVTIFHRTEKGEFQRRRIDDVKIQAMNPFLDLALLRIPRPDDLKFTPVFLAREDDHREGDSVFAIGNPLGLERSVSEGIVSTRNRNFEGLVYIQTTTQINPGNSGGPLFNTRGEVVGVTNMKIPLGEGLGFAIPVAYLKYFLENRDAFAFDRDNPNAGHRYLDAPRRKTPAQPPSEVTGR